MAFDGRVNTGKFKHVRCVSNPGRWPDVVAGKWYQVREPSQFVPRDGNGNSDFDYFDDAGDWVWGRYQDDPACTWGETVYLSLDVAEYLNSKVA